MRSISAYYPAWRLWRWAFFLICPFLVTHLFGFQEHVSVLAGVHSGGAFQVSAGVCYLILSFSAVCIVPTLMIAGLLRWIWDAGTS